MREVNVIFTATDKHGHFKKDLHKEDLQILDDGKPPETIKDFRSETDLPLGVVRVLLGDLRERGLIAITGPASQATAAESVLRSVLDGLGSKLAHLLLAELGIGSK